MVKHNEKINDDNNLEMDGVYCYILLYTGLKIRHIRVKSEVGLK
jgi:hypothetical protein